MAGIFISYRRDDAKHAAGRLVDRLVSAVGRDKLFMDVDNIEPGLDFVKVLNDQVGRADVLLALIGPGWLNARDAKGNRRLDNPADFVRIEIEAALARDIRVVPVLLDGAELPEAETLPESLRPLLRRNAVRISHERFGAEADDLAAAMKRVPQPLTDSPPGYQPHSTTEDKSQLRAAALMAVLVLPVSYFAGVAAVLASSWLGLISLSGSAAPLVVFCISPTLIALWCWARTFLFLRRHPVDAQSSTATLYWLGSSIATGFLFGPFSAIATQNDTSAPIQGWLLGLGFALASVISFKLFSRQRA